MPVTKDQATALAELAVACRPHGAPRWDAAGVVAAIGKVKHLALADVALAAIRAADDRTVQTPGVIAAPTSPCWRERGTDRPQPPQPYDHGTVCGTCDQPETRCRANRHSGHDYQPKPDLLRAAVARPKGDA